MTIAYVKSTQSMSESGHVVNMWTCVVIVGKNDDDGEDGAFLPTISAVREAILVCYGPEYSALYESGEAYSELLVIPCRFVLRIACRDGLVRAFDASCRGVASRKRLFRDSQLGIPAAYDAITCAGTVTARADERNELCAEKERVSDLCWGIFDQECHVVCFTRREYQYFAAIPTHNAPRHCGSPNSSCPPQSSMLRGGSSADTEQKQYELFLRAFGPAARNLMQLVGAFFAFYDDDQHGREEEKPPLSPCSLPLLAASSVLLSGAPGKSAVVQRICAAQNVARLTLSPSLLVQRYGTDISRGIAQAADEAARLSPCVLVFDRLNVLLPSSLASGSLTTEHILVRDALMSVIYDSPQRGVFIIGVASSSNVDAMVVRCFEHRLRVIAPRSTPERLNALLFCLTQQDEFDLNDAQISAIAAQVLERCDGFSGADIKRLVEISAFNGGEAVDDAVDDATCVRRVVWQFECARQMIRPSGLHRATIVRPSLTWDEIGGLDDVKKRLDEFVVWPMQHHRMLLEAGLKPSGGVILFGPPGTGKTMLARAVATHARANFITLHVSDLVRSGVGDSEKAVVEAFQMARSCAPCILFIDEFQSVFGSRDASSESRVGRLMVSQLLHEMDGQQAFLSGVAAYEPTMVIAATNVLGSVDKAFLRPGRFDQVLYVGPPDATGRRHILDAWREKMGSWHEDVNIDSLVKQTSGLTGAELASVCQRAGMNALMRDPSTQCIRMDDFLCITSTYAAEKNT